MTKNVLGGVILLVVVTAAISPRMASSQESGRQQPDPPSTVETGESSNAQLKLPEFEFVGSTSFRSASLVQPVWSRLGVEGHYFGGDENNVGYTAGSWTFKGKHWKIAPGFGVAFGDNGFQTMPALSLRWGYQQNWFVTEGLFVQGLRHTKFLPEGTESEGEHSSEESVVPSIADGNHLSARWKRITFGGTWEHMQFREGKEWKGGVRVAYRILPFLSLTFFAMGPGSEIRGGILFQPEEKE